jgi:hypothetical protein
MKMDFDDDDDESSVESECQDGNMKEGIVYMDDISVVSKGFGGVRISKTDSVESLFSTESSIEISLAHSTDGMNAGNAKWAYRQQPQGRKITLLNLPQQMEESVPLKVESGRGLQRSAMNNSCGSIKDHLSFGSIDEHKDYDSMLSSDEESSDGEYQKRHTSSRPRFTFTTSEDNSVSDESSVDDAVINSILRKTDSKEHIIGTSRAIHSTKHAERPRVSGRGKPKNITSDVLLNKFIKNRRVERSHPDGNANEKVDSADHVLPDRVHARLDEMKPGGNALNSMMNKSDSLNHVGLQGRRVVKTIKDVRHSVKPHGSSNGSTDPLMERFLASKVKEEVSRRATTGRGKGSVFISTDSLQRVHGKGQRQVGTRAPDLGSLGK